jgi:hypothetical protein
MYCLLPAPREHFGYPTYLKLYGKRIKYALLCLADGAARLILKCSLRAGNME